MQTSERIIHSRAGATQLADVIQSIFVSELIYPSNSIWIVSPWISDIPVIDNISNQFLILDPTWSRRQIRLTEVLEKLLVKGSSVRIATAPYSTNHNFLDRLSHRYNNLEEDVDLKVNQKQELHEKGILGDNYYLSGSMNFTYSGLTINEEKVSLQKDPEVVAENRIVMLERWG